MKKLELKISNSNAYTDVIGTSTLLLEFPGLTKVGGNAKRDLIRNQTIQS